LIPKVNYLDPDDLSFATENLNEIKADWYSEFTEKMPWLESNDIAEYNKMLSIICDQEMNDSYDSKDLPDWYEVINDFNFLVIDSTISYMAYSCKHHSFCEEDEYRLVFNSRDSSGMEIRFKEGSSFLVPYVEILYNFEGGNIIEEVIVGPCPHTVEAASSAQQFLDSKLGQGVGVIDSKIPYRYW
jgi:hypothetical protein